MATAEETARLLAGTEVFSGLEPARARGRREGRRAPELGSGRDPLPRGRRRGHAVTWSAREPSCSRASTRTAASWRSPSSVPATLFGELAMFRGETRSASAEAIEHTTAVALLAGRHAAADPPQPRPRAEAAGRAGRAGEPHHRAAPAAVLPDRRRTGGGHAARPDGHAPGRGRGRPRRADRATQAEIAQLSGTSRESASRFLATLERAGLVTLGRGKVTVHEPGGSATTSTEAARRMVRRQLRGRGNPRRPGAGRDGRGAPRAIRAGGALRRRAYDDGALPIGEGQTISQPWIVACMAQLARASGRRAVLEVGTGSGYSAAVLSRLCARVLTMERYGASPAEAAARAAGRAGLRQRGGAPRRRHPRRARPRALPGHLGHRHRGGGAAARAARAAGRGRGLVCPVERGGRERLMRVRDGEEESWPGAVRATGRGRGAVARQ